MGNFTKTALIGAIAFATLPVGAVFAADIVQPVPPTYYYPPAPVEYGSNWYLRLDGGIKWYNAPTATFDETTLGYDVPGAGEFIDESMSRSWLIGAGFGFQLSPTWRTDITFDYEWPGHFEGYLVCPSPCTVAPDPEYSFEEADISALTFLWNVYYDIPLSHGFTPYVGLGVGAARLTTTNVNFTNPDGSTGSWAGASTWNFAWSATVGTSWAITDSVALDLNYRYVSLGSAQAVTTLGPGGNTPINYDHISAHELRVGLRLLALVGDSASQ